MKTLLVLACLVVNSWTLSAAELTGTWRTDQPRRGGVTLHSYLMLEDKGEGFDGQIIINDCVVLPLRNPHWEGDTAVFAIDWNMTFFLKPAGETLKVRIVHRSGSTDETVAVRVDPAETKPPAALPLQELEDVPPNGLALTPPMGWSSWNYFADRVDDKVVRETADAMVKSGMKAAGYVYVNIDDTWEGERDAQGRIQSNAKFPDMKALADYVHSLGLKLGIYSSPGPRTCGGYIGSYGHEEQDAKTFAEWGIDYLKHDWCSAARVYGEKDLRRAYQRMGKALRASGRPMVYSLCEYGMGDVWTWGPKVGANLWRTTGDIQDNWKSVSEIGFSQHPLAAYAGPGHWNDPDMLEVGNGGMTTTEYRTHFSLWCLLAAPLMAGNDLRSMTPDTLEILTNREAIAIDQDPLGRQAERVFGRGEMEVWARPLQGGRRAIGIFNRGEKGQSLQTTWQEVGQTQAPTKVRDVWLHQDVGAGLLGQPVTVPSHGVVLLVVE